MDPIFWAALLLALGFVFALAEMFIPSGGALGFLAIGSIVGSIILAFYVGSLTTGVSFIIITGLTIPVLMGVAFKLWPKTPIGRRLILDLPRENDVKPDHSALKALLGKFGKAKSVMLPSGPVEIDGRTYDAVSDGVAIEKGEAIKVVEVRANRIVVRSAKSEKPPAAPGPRGDDVLSRGIDELGLEDPLA